MSYKKNAVSYGIWALYLMGIGIVLSFMGMVIGHQSTEVPYMAITLLVLAVGALFVVYFLVKRLMDSAQVRKVVSGRTGLLEGIVVAVFLAVGIVLRLAMTGGAGEEAAYYEVAKVTESGMRVRLVQGSVYYYLCLLHLLFRLVGNKWMAGIMLQIVLQLLGIVIAYFAVRRLSGRGPALVSLIFLTVAPGSVRDGITYSPKMLYFCVYALILLIIAQYLWRSARPGGRVLTWILALVCGALVAFAGYMDIVGFTLAIPLCGLLVLKREQRGILQWVAQFLLSMLTMAGTFCLLVLLDGSMSGSTFARVLGAWGVTYGLKGADYSFFFREGGYETILLLLLMALGIFTFMRRKNEERFSPWVMMVLSVTLMRVLGVMTPNMNGSFQMYFAMTGLAGVAFCELFVRDGARVEETAGVSEEVVEDLDEEPLKSVAGAARDTLVSAVSNVEVKNDMTEKKRNEPQRDGPKQVQLLENPLPLPKKHVKKVMDYPIQPDASQMHYDIEVDPKDNFDF